MLHHVFGCWYVQIPWARKPYREDMEMLDSWGFHWTWDADGKTDIHLNWGPRARQDHPPAVAVALSQPRGLAQGWHLAAVAIREPQGRHLRFGTRPRRGRALRAAPVPLHAPRRHGADGPGPGPRRALGAPDLHAPLAGVAAAPVPVDRRPPLRRGRYHKQRLGKLGPASRVRIIERPRSIRRQLTRPPGRAVCHGVAASETYP